MIRAMSDDTFYRVMMGIKVGTDENARKELAEKLINTDGQLRSYVSKQIPKGGTKQDQIEFLLENF